MPVTFQSASHTWTPFILQQASKVGTVIAPLQMEILGQERMRNLLSHILVMGGARIQTEVAWHQSTQKYYGIEFRKELIQKDLQGKQLPLKRYRTNWYYNVIMQTKMNIFDYLHSEWSYISYYWHNICTEDG